MINFDSSLDRFSAEPISLNSEDRQKIENYYQSQYDLKTSTEMVKSLYETGTMSTPIKFRTDDLPKFYEVFRVHSPPTQWSDFNNARVAVLDVDEQQSTLIDYIVPNTEYYYTFRSVDIHGNISNPTNILKVILVDDQGIFPLIENYDFERNAKSGSGFKKTVRRFLQITPVFEQLVYKDNRQPNQMDSVANQDNVVLGVAKDSIYGKALKIRLTSKKSGKTFDINVKFDRKHTKPQ